MGNPGMERTRHSVGMAVVGALAARLGVADRWRGDKHVSGEVIVSEIERTAVVLLRPKLLMNVNGVSVAKAGELRINTLYFRVKQSLCYKQLISHLMNVLCLLQFVSTFTTILELESTLHQIFSLYDFPSS